MVLSASLSPSLDLSHQLQGNRKNATQYLPQSAEVKERLHETRSSIALLHEEARSSCQREGEPGVAGSGSIEQAVRQRLGTEHWMKAVDTFSPIIKKRAHMNIT